MKNWWVTIQKCKETLVNQPILSLSLMQDTRPVIDLTNILTYLPKEKVKEITTITERVIATSKVEMVILFGSYARGTFSDKQGKVRGRKSDYDILVVARQKSTVTELKELLENKFDDISRIVNLEIQPINFVNSNLEDAHYFFLDVKREGKVLFDSGRFELSDPKELTPTKRREIAEKDFAKWFRDSKDFLKLSKTAIDLRNFGLAAFNFQQCAELCYITVEMVFRHYRTREHKLDLLRRKMKRFDSRIDIPFPLGTKEEKALFEHLNFAYIGGRYLSEEEYAVTKEQLEYWNKEAKKLIKQTEVVCKEQIEALKVIEKKWLENGANTSI